MDIPAGRRVPFQRGESHACRQNISRRSSRLSLLSGWALSPSYTPTAARPGNANTSLSCSSGSHLSFQTACDWEGSGKTTGQWVGLRDRPVRLASLHLHLALTSIPNAANAPPHCCGVGTASVDKTQPKSHPPFGRRSGKQLQKHTSGVASTFPPV